MVRISARLQRGQHDAAFAEFYRGAAQRMERGALIATDRAQKIAVANIRQAMAGAGLGRLGNAIDGNSDLSEGRSAHRIGSSGASASGVVFVRSRSPRTLGAIESYTQGATIAPRRGRWLWIPSEEIQRRTGAKNQRVRVTPETWSTHGLDRKIGRLVPVKAANGLPLLIVENVGVSAEGKSRSARSLTKQGKARKGQVRRDFVVAFVAIPRTTRTARVDVTAIIRGVQAQLPALFDQAMGRN